MGKRAKAASLPGIVLSTVVLKHAKDRTNLLDVLARLVHGLSLARCDICQFIQGLFELPGDNSRDVFGRRFPFFYR
jgi:hypothetical protein